MEKKTMTIVIVAIIIVAVAACACYFLLKDKGGDEPAPVYEGVWATKAVHVSYFEDGSAHYEEESFVVEDITVSKEADFYKFYNSEGSFYAVQNKNGLLSADVGDDGSTVVIKQPYQLTR